MLTFILCNNLNSLFFYQRIEYPNKLKAISEADYHQKLLLRFVLRDKIAGGTKTMTAHQTFVQLLHGETKQEIVFVAEPDVGNQYKFDLVRLS